MNELDRRVRHRVYQGFVATGTPPSVHEVAVSLNIPTEDVGRSMTRLAAAHELVVAADGSIGMAHPFSGGPTDHMVTMGSWSCYANCTWDALAIPAMLGNAVVTTRDALSGQPWQFTVDAEVGAEGVVWFPVPARSFWDDIEFT